MCIPDSLIDELVHGTLVPFVGSGASLSVKSGLFPTWPGLLESMARRLDENAKPKEAVLVRTFVDMDRVYDAAEEALRGLGKAEFFNLMRCRFQVEQPEDVDLSPDERQRDQLLLELLGKQSLYVSGASGSGKSTFCRWVTSLACEGEMQPHAIPAPDEFDESLPAPRTAAACSPAGTTLCQPRVE